MKIRKETDLREFEKCNRGVMYSTLFEGREEMHRDALGICLEYNRTDPHDMEKRKRLICELFGRVGKNPYVEPFVFCGFGFNIEVGDNFYANNNCHFMDPAKIIFGNNVFIGPDCGFYTAHHPMGYKLRNQLYEYAYPITVGDNVWIGGHVTVVPGINIGSNVVIGAGSVVTQDIPDHCVAAGNPCKIIRALSPSGEES